MGLKWLRKVPGSRRGSQQVEELSITGDGDGTSGWVVQPESTVDGVGGSRVGIRTSPQLVDLPEELLFDIMVHVRNCSSAREFLACLLCCQQWYRISVPLLHEDVVLVTGTKPISDHRLKSFSQRSKQFLDEVRSLTIHMFDPPTPPSRQLIFPLEMSRRANSPKWLRSFGLALADMSNLSTFSLKVDDHGHVRPWVAQGAIEKLLGSLPLSVVNLEVDTLSADYITPGPSHLCDVISPLLPRLKSLRLRLRFVCPALLASIIQYTHSADTTEAPTTKLASSLESCVIRLGFNYALNCHVATAHTRRCNNPAQHQYAEARQVMATALRQAYEGGAFPKLQRLFIVDRQDPDDPSFRFSVIKVCDVLANTTTTMPWRLFREASTGVTWYALRTLEGELLHQNLEDIATLVEREASWTQTVTGSRLPTGNRTSRTTMGKHHTFNEVRPTSRAIVEPRLRTPEFLWAREDQLELQLLSATVKEGLLDTSLPRLSLPASGSDLVAASLSA